MYDIIYIGQKTKNWKNLKERFFSAKRADSFEEAQKKSLTSMFWAVWPDIEILEDFDMDFEPDDWSKDVPHLFKNKETYDGLCLIPSGISLSKNEIDYRFFINKKEIDIVASNPIPFDYFEIDSYEEYLQALEQSNTDMFWMGSKNIEVNSELIENFYISHHEKIDRNQNHAFQHVVKNDILYNGLFLCSKSKVLTKREVEYRFPVNRKEWEVIGSGPKTYDKFIIDTYEDYENALTQSSTEMFWAIKSDVDCDFFDFGVYFDFENKYDRSTNHSFLHDENGELLKNSVWLLSKNKKVSQKEIDYRFLVGAKEWDVVASKTKKYDRFVVNNYQDYKSALENTTTEMFWAIPDRVKITDESIFDLTYPIQNKFDDTFTFERSINHVFKNGEYYDGLILCSKACEITKKEFDFGFIVQKKEVDRVVSEPLTYDKVFAKDYDDYVKQLKTSSTDFVWIVPNDVDVIFDYEYQVPTWEKENIHIFKNGKYNDGVFLQHIDRHISSREFEFCWHTRKKEVDIIASTPKLYDIVFISYQEPNADENFERLMQKFPNRTIHRVHGIKGIHQAHIMAAETSETEMFYVVDGDAIIVDDFNFDYQVPKWQKDQVYVWRTQNPVNGLVYGYGGVKLFPRKETIKMDTTKPDMTTSISSKFNAVHAISNITAFNTGPFETWKSAFRECAKLSSKVIDRQKDDETNERLKIWTTVGRDRLFGEYAIRGARAGMGFGLSSSSDIRLINDFSWLKERFDANT